MSFVYHFLGGLSPRRWAARFVSIVFAIGMTVFISAYTAQLTATNIENEDERNFKGLADEKV